MYSDEENNEDKKMKVVIVTAGILPVPATKGGAIETRVTYLADENERIGLWNLEICSIYEKCAEKESQKYNRTKFEYFYPDQKKERWYYFWNRGAKKIVKNKKLLFERILIDSSLNSVIRFLKKEKDIDVIILENKPLWVLKLSQYTDAPIVLHLGNDHLNKDTFCAKEIGKKVAGIMTVSDYIARCVSTVPEIDPEKIYTVRQGIDQNLFNPEYFDENERKEVCSELGIQKADFVFYFAGRIEKEKGVLELIKAFRRFDKEPVKLLIIGDVSVWNSDRTYLNSVKEEAEKCEGKVVFVGNVSHEKTALLQSVADVAVLPSLWNEPAGNAMIECMVAGIPLITTNRGGIPEYCPSGRAILVDVTDDIEEDLYREMKKLYQNKSIRDKMHVLEKEIGANYTTEYHYCRIDEVLRTVLNRKYR